MQSANPISVELDLARKVRWTSRAEARLSSVDYNIDRAMEDLTQSRKRLYAMCLFIWAGLQDRLHPFAAPEDVAQYLESGEQQVSAIAIINAMLDEAGLLEPANEDAKKKSLSAETASVPGLGPSSN